MIISSFIKGDNTLTPARKKQREVLVYLIFGVLTTLVNFITYSLLKLAFENSSLITKLLFQTIAWVVAVMFAFLTNRAWVFCSKGPFFKEMVAFFSARVVTLILFEILLFVLLSFILKNALNTTIDGLFLSFAGLDIEWDIPVKIIISVFVVVSNYFFSKWFIFTKKNNAPGSDSEDLPDNEDV